MARARSSGAVAGPLGSLYTLGATGHLSDGQLLDRFLSRDDPTAAEAAFAELVDRHGAMVRAVCLRELGDPHDAHDAFQATFLVLVSRAATVRRRDSVGGWLFGIARRVSARARVERARRRRHLRRLGERIAREEDTARAEEPGADVAPLLDEVDRLPERFRAPVVLHYFEGLSAEATAQRLGCPRGTVLSRLSRARDRLRRGLERRGASPAVLAPTRWLSAAMLPERLVQETVRAAGSLGLAGAAIDGMVSANVAGLARRAARASALARIGLAVSLILVAAIGLGAILSPRGMMLPGPAPLSLPEEDAGPLVFRGRVVNPDGRPVAGARLYLKTFRWADRDRPQPVRATSDREGRFNFTVDRGEFNQQDFIAPWRDARVIAMVGEAAAGGSDSGPDEGDIGRDLTVRLARDDVPVVGRLIDREGRPVAGATVRVAAILGPIEGDLAPWLEAVAAHRGDLYELEHRYLRELRSPPHDHLPESPPATTDPDGRFTIRGIGRDRLVDLRIEGPTIRTMTPSAMTRTGLVVRVPYFGTRTDDLAKTYHPSRFEVAAPPSRPIEGIVRDRDTGAPIAGATIRSHRLADQDLINNTLIRTTTDASGRFRMTGMPLGAGNEVLILPPSDRPYLPSLRKLGALTAGVPMRAEFALKRGVWVEGRVTDRSTGRPAGASLRYAAARSNPHLAEAPGFADIFLNGNDTAAVDTDADGTFRIAALPGRGLLAAQWDGTRYTGPGSPSLSTLDRGQFVPHIYQGEPFAEIDVPPDRPAPRCDLALVPTRTIEGVVLDPQGRPIAGTRINGGFGPPFWGWPIDSARFRAYGLAPPRSPSIGRLFRARSLDAAAEAVLPERPRLLLFQNEARKLAGWASVDATTRGPLQIRLESWGTLSGRMVRQSGTPRAAFAFEPMAVDPNWLGGDAIAHHPQRIVTDAHGRFRAEGLVPGLRYRLMLDDARGVNTWEGPSVPPLRPGEVRDLGDVVAVVRGGADP